MVDRSAVLKLEEIEESTGVDQSVDYPFTYTANVNRQTTDKLLFSLAIITDENM